MCINHFHGNEGVGAAGAHVMKRASKMPLTAHPRLLFLAVINIKHANAKWRHTILSGEISCIIIYL